MADSLRQSSTISSVQSNYSVREPDFILEISEQTDAHEKDTTCLNCQRKFNIPGLSISKKLVCPFCYRGVCGKCLFYEYYHQKSKKIEKMCVACHHNLAVSSQKYNQELQLYRLERAELWKEIKLAQEQKVFYSKERQIAFDELKSLKETISLNNQSKSEQLIELNAKNKELESKVSQLDASLNSSNSKISNLKEVIFKSKKDLEQLKSQKGQESDEKERLKAEVSAMTQRISLLKGNFKEITEEETFSRIDLLKDEIAELESKLSMENHKIHSTEEIVSEITQLIGKNELKIDEVNVRLSDRRNSCAEFNAIEEQMLNDLRKQLKDLDDLIQIRKKRKEVNLRKQGTSPYSVSSEFQPSIIYTSVYSIEDKREPEQRRCLNCVVT